MSSVDELERSLLEDDSLEEKETATEEKPMPRVLSGLGKTLETISTAMLNMEKSINRLQSNNDTNGGPSKKRRLASEPEAEMDGDNSDAEGLPRSNKPDADSANEGNTSDPHVRLEQDALLTEISQDLEE